MYSYSLQANLLKATYTYLTGVLHICTHKSWELTLSVKIE